jgi:hypothetical protein
MLKLLIMGFLLSRSTSLSAGLATSRAASRLLSRRVQYRAAMTALRPLSWEVANNQSSPNGQFESVRIPATAELLRAMPRSNPNSVNNIIALLRSDAIKGIGPKLASALTTRFGERTLVVLRGAGSAQEEAALHTHAGPGLAIAYLLQPSHQFALHHRCSCGLDTTHHGMRIQQSPPHFRSRPTSMKKFPAHGTVRCAVKVAPSNLLCFERWVWQSVVYRARNLHIQLTCDVSRRISAS